MLYFFILIIVLSVVLSLPKVKGFFGESTVRFYLNRLDKKEYTIINDLLIHKEDGKTSQIDHIVVSQYGIFVVETKNYKGWIFGNENSQYWTQTKYKRKDKFYNPVWQNKGHIKALEKLLSDFGDIPYISIVAFSNDAELKKVSSASTVTYFSRVNKEIRKYQQEVLSKQTVDMICKCLSNSNIKEKEARKRHASSIRNDIKASQRKVREGICPRCGGQLVQRQGKYGSFVGCTGYPKCRYVLKSAR